MMGKYAMSGSSCFLRLASLARASAGTDKRGTKVTPMPAATMCLMVSSDEPSKLLRMPSALLENRANSGHTSSTWSRKQWPVPSSNMVSFLSCSAVIDFFLASPCLTGKAAMKGSSYKAAVAKPMSGKGSAKMAQSISPARNISISLTVKFSCSIKGICGAFFMICRIKSGNK